MRDWEGVLVGRVGQTERVADSLAGKMAEAARARVKAMASKEGGREVA